MGSLIAFLIRIGFGGLVDKGLAVLEKRIEAETDREKLRSEMTVAIAREMVSEAEIMAQFNTAKLSHRGFWVLLFAVSAPFVVWEWAVVIDGLPVANRIFGAEQVADLPTPALQEAFAAMVKWVFFVGTGVGALKALTR